MRKKRKSQTSLQTHLLVILTTRNLPKRQRNPRVRLNSQRFKHRRSPRALPRSMVLRLSLYLVCSKLTRTRCILPVRKLPDAQLPPRVVLKRDTRSLVLQTRHLNSKNKKKICFSVNELEDVVLFCNTDTIIADFMDGGNARL